MDDNLKRFLENTMKLNNLMSKIQHDPTKRQLMDKIMGFVINILSQVLEFTDEKENYIVNFAGKKAGKAPIAIHLSFIENHNQDEYQALKEAAGGVLKAQFKHHDKLLAEGMATAGAVPENVPPKKEYVSVEMQKKEDGSVDIIFK